MHVWVLLSFLPLVLLRLTQLAAYSQADAGLPWLWRSMVVLAPGQYQVFFGVMLGFLVYWVLKGTVWYVQLVSADRLCADLIGVKLWLIGLYAAVIYYVTVEMIGLIAICGYSEEEESQGLLQEYAQESEPNEASICAICLLPVLATQQVRQLSCGHFGHGACIDDWLNTSSVCPTCHDPIR